MHEPNQGAKYDRAEPRDYTDDKREQTKPTQSKGLNGIVVLMADRARLERRHLDVARFASFCLIRPIGVARHRMRSSEHCGFAGRTAGADLQRLDSPPTSPFSGSERRVTQTPNAA
ncbi:hypothetical protein [Paraburkholderia dilworthii]|uniref:Uncharacterized protein n=1 Tax=Paraburkholderia dilworthii TaxID=948106 RepID=A0ABW9D5Y3_9BURK